MAARLKLFTTPPSQSAPKVTGWLCDRSTLLAFLQRNELAARRPGEKLPRAADLLVGVADQLVPLRNPPDRAGEREYRGEHAHRNAERFVNDAGIKIDIRIELALDEV